MPDTITKTQATAAFKVVVARYQEWIDEGWAEPILMKYDDTTWAVAWEEGPEDWAHVATMGGHSEEHAVLAAQAAAEFGVPFNGVPDEDPLKFPAGVYAEPIYSFMLGLYPA